MVSAETIQLDKLQFRESFAENVNISGSVRAGVMYRSNLPNATPDSLYIDIGSKSNQILCARILSVDGKYGADIDYQLTGNRSGFTQFQLPTIMHDVVTSYTPNQLAVLAEIKPRCKSRKGHIVPASWGKPLVTSGIVKVFLNSGANNTFLKLYKHGGGSKKLSCNPIEAERNTAYDTECSIKNVEIYDLGKTKIIRTNFGNHSRPLRLQIFISKGHT